ncbi:MAG: DUF5107 domain-containing protein [Kiritimatiellae bacterium]|nr:DUF5107 domain-containing protein [Kiritimatiellia bacterium]
MSTLRFETLTMPGARLGGLNPLPVLHPLRTGNEATKRGGRTAGKDDLHIGYGIELPCLPYGVQDGYDRVRGPRPFRTAVLENDLIRATFLLELGGRLWSLFDKAANRELLYVNPVFQPANLAIRNAWFSGGIEWNMGIRGHSPFTCSPLFAARLTSRRGEPVLRLYEFERVRCCAFQMDFHLRDDRPFLFARICIRNPHGAERPMYWWTNAAVAEADGVRVLIPADSAYRFDYEGGLKPSPVPIQDGQDVSYPKNMSHAKDFFYRIPDGCPPWQAALGGDGYGIVQTSTPLLKGRKMFVWGTGQGGRTWQDYLSEPGHPYFEIQAGLGRTQSGCIPMPAGATWTWLEAWGPLQADAGRAHGGDWAAAQAEVESRLQAAIEPAWLAEEMARGAEWGERPPDELVQAGSGWGALERRRRAASGERPLCSPALPFPEDTLGSEQAPWRHLLEHGVLPETAPAEAPGAWMTQREWFDRLRHSVSAGAGAHWLAWLHLGLMHYARREPAEARAAWERSVALQPSAWAYRNLALLACHAREHARCAALYMHACRLARLPQLFTECGRALIAAGRPAEVGPLFDALDESARHGGRIQLVRAQAALEADDLDAVERFVDSAPVIPDIREGEVTLTDLWFALQERKLAATEGTPIDDALRKRARRDFPPPAHLDFRQKT